jgi:hypothetical protein
MHTHRTPDVALWDQYRALREQWTHEDMLVSQRVTWLILAEACCSPPTCAAAEDGGSWLALAFPLFGIAGGHADRRLHLHRDGGHRRGAREFERAGLADLCPLAPSRAAGPARPLGAQGPALRLRRHVAAGARRQPARLTLTDTTSQGRARAPRPEHRHDPSAAATRRKVPFRHKVAFGLGMLANQMFPAALGIFMVVLVQDLGFPGWMWGILFFLPRVFDSVTDPIMGFISDNTRSRWGRRTTTCSSAPS